MRQHSSTDLCGGRSATAVPTATGSDAKQPWRLRRPSRPRWGKRSTPREIATRAVCFFNGGRLKLVVEIGEFFEVRFSWRLFVGFPDRT